MIWWGLLDVRLLALFNVGKNTFEVCFLFLLASMVNALRFLARYWWKCGNGITWEERTILQLQKIHSRKESIFPLHYGKNFAFPLEVIKKISKAFLTTSGRLQLLTMRRDKKRTPSFFAKSSNGILLTDFFWFAKSNLVSKKLSR